MAPTGVGGKDGRIEFREALFVPELRVSLVSIAEITKGGHRAIFTERDAKVVDCDNNVILAADCVDGLYHLRSPVAPECNQVSAANNARGAPPRNSLEDWHRRMGHLNVKSLREAIRFGHIEGAQVNNADEDFECDICARGKMSRVPFPKASTRKSGPGDIIHSDVCGPMRVESQGKKRYFVTFIDDYSGWCEVRFIKNKNQVLEEFEKVRALFATQFGRCVKQLQTDNGREYLSDDFDTFLEGHGITRRLTAPHNPEQNGVAERRNRTLLDAARCLLIQSGLPSSFWAEAVNTANHVRNRAPTSRLKGATPHEKWIGRKPDVSSFEAFGSEVFAMDRSPSKGKLAPRSRKGVFLGYSAESKAYRVWLLEEKKVEVTRDVQFLRKFPTPSTDNPEEFCSQDTYPRLDDSLDGRGQSDAGDFLEVNLDRSRAARSQPGGGNVPRYDGEPNAIEIAEEAAGDANVEIEGGAEDAPQSTRRGPGRPRVIRTGQRGRPRKVHSAAQAAAETREEFSLVTEVPVSEALGGPTRGEWISAMADEMASILTKDTWTLVDRAEAPKVIGSRFVLRNKFGTDGILQKRKARVVARGFAQSYGKDFHETYAPVARLGSIRAAVALAARDGMYIRQYDVETAYLNGHLDEEVFMELPQWTGEALENIVRHGGRDRATIEKAASMSRQMASGDKVCRMNKALYGLKQAGRAWYERLDAELQSLGAIPTKADPCVYTTGRGGNFTMIIIYVDDILVMSRSEEQILEFGKALSQVFEIKDLGEVKRCLGMDFTRSKGGIFVNQRTYISDVLRRFRMLECNPVATPMDPGIRLERGNPWSEEDGERPPYRELIGCLLYLSVATRPDIAHATSSLSQYNDGFSKAHWNAAKRVLRYLKGTIDVGLFYRSEDNSMKGYADADWAGSKDDRRSYTGYAFLVAGGAVSWDSRKQRTVALSTAEAEYMALAEAAKEAIYLRRLLQELGSRVCSITLHSDNVSAQKLALNPVHHARTKHIDIRYHFIREVVQSGQVIVDHVASGDMAADILTKPLPRDPHRTCSGLLGLVQDARTGDRIEGKC